ncbi:MAG TPA: CarD family transcriptional regulator [Anaerolineae bacterium]|nr:CarD family transcriptional regulator [Anaerolineae bacterium]
MKEPHTYTQGEWIVHSQYGIGQIKGTDTKRISGEPTDYFRIEAEDSTTFWVPVDQMDHDKIRPLSTQTDIQQVINTLQNPPKKMSSNYKTRQSRIRTTRLRNTPEAIAKLVRDLWGHRRRKGGLNITERRAFRTFKKRLVREWSIVVGKNSETIATKLNNILNNQWASAD